tara:strand:- start:83 stop:994 length:912 start_codon:yes stop_codon:yes gene_type:complete
MENWAIIALISAGISGLVSIFDKTVLYRFVTNSHTLPLLIALIQMSFGTLTILIVSSFEIIHLEYFFLPFIAGALFGLQGHLFLKVTFSNEITRTVPISQIYPIFTAFFALLFLDENILLYQWVGILLIVIGAILIVMDFSGDFWKIKIIDKAFGLLVIGSLLYSAANITSKLAVEEASIIQVHAVRMFALGFVFFLLNFRKDSYLDVKNMIQSKSKGFLFVFTNEVFLVNVHFYLALLALSLGPVSLVTAILSVRSLFLLIFTIVVSVLFKWSLGESITPKIILIKGLSTSVIVAGLALLVI